jgi:tetratricopeptide (TPR) repeat protein
MTKLRTLLMAVVAVFVVSGVSAQTTAADVLKKFNEATELIQQSKFNEAIANFEIVLQKGASMTDAQVVQAVTEARKKMPVILVARGKQLAGQKKFEEAIGVFKMAQKRAQLNSDMRYTAEAKKFIVACYKFQGNDLLNAGKSAEAIEMYKQGAAIDKNNTELRLLIARSFGAMNNYAEASNILKEVIALEKRHDRYRKDAQAAKLMFNNFMLKGATKSVEANKYADAIKYLDEILSVDAKEPKAHLMKVQIANNMKKFNDVIKFGPVAANALTDPAEKSSVNFFMGSAYGEMKNYEKAIECFKKVTAGEYVKLAKDQIAELSK